MANFTGGSADDAFVGTADPDTATGEGGNDALFGLGGNDQLDGGDGNDTLDGGDNNDVLIGGAGQDSLAGGNGDDTLYSHAADPAFGGFLGRGISYDIYTEIDTLTGGGGNDYIFAGYGDSVDGGAHDTYGDKLFISFRGAPSGVIADFRLFNTQASITIGGGTITNIEEVGYIEGSEFADLLASWGGGYTVGQAIYGRGGNDQIYAGYYAGWAGTGIYGGDGDDRIDLTGAGYGPTSYGEAGDDYIIGGSSYERLEGGEGNDVLEGNYGFDSLYGGGGNDTADGGSFGDNMYGEGGNDVMYGAGDADLLEGGDGDDLLYGDYSLISSAGGLSPASNDDTLRGGAGIDTLHGDQGNDTLDGGADNDLLYGGAGNDSMTGGAGADRMEGGDGNDTFYGGDGADLLLSGTGSDQLSGEGDNDRLYFGAAFDGTDLAAGGAGTDELLLQANYAALTLSGSNIVSIETVRLLSAADSSIVAAPGGSFSYTVATADSLVPGGGSLVVDASGLGAGEVLNFDGTAEASGRLSVVGGAAADLIVTGGGNDLLDGGAGADTMRGRGGHDIYYVDNAGDIVEEIGTGGEDEIRTSLASYSLVGTNVENLTATSAVAHDFRGNMGPNVITGGAGNDFLRLNDGGSDTARGGDGDDVFLFGSMLGLSDTVDGGAGRDQIALQGNYSTTIGSGIVGLESIAILAGSDTRFGDPGTNFYDYDLATLDENVAAGVQMIVDASGLRVGEDFSFEGKTETDGSFFIYGGRGTDTLTGGWGNDAFYFGEGMQWGASDVLNGGPGGIDQLGLRGSYTIVFGAGQLVGIENIGLVSAQDTRFGPQGASYNYNLTMNDGNVAAGVQLTLDAFALRGGETLTFNGAAETNGTYRIFGGQGFDNITGGQGNDIIAGHAGPDSLTGGPGADQFRYYRSTDSVGATDLILDFTPGTDKIDLIRIDADTHAAGDQAFHWIGSNAFGAAGAASAGELRATFNSGNGSWLVEGDTDGNGSADFAITLYLQGPTPPGAGDFFL